MSFFFSKILKSVLFRPFIKRSISAPTGRREPQLYKAVLLTTIALAISSTLLSCAEVYSNGDVKAEKTQTAEPVVNQLADIASQISEALSEDSLTDIKSTSKKILKITEDLDPAAYGGEEAPAYKNINVARIHAKVLSDKDYDIETTRKVFAPMSDAIAEMLLSAPAESDKYYVFYCSMAGHYWIQTDRNIRNPFYGSEMLKCGDEVTSASVKSRTNEPSTESDESDPFSVVNAPPSDMAQSILKKMVCGCCNKALISATCGCAQGMKKNVSAIVDEMESENSDINTIIARLKEIYGEGAFPSE